MIQIVLPHDSNLQVFLKGQNGLVEQKFLSASLTAHMFKVSNMNFLN